MNVHALMEGLAGYLCVVVIITLHEFGHAWMASKCGDDTARLLGRVTLNPIAHIDPIGTVFLPLLIVVLAISGAGDIARFIIGWGKPVPVNYLNLRRKGLDDILVAMAGPAMNVLLTIVVLAAARLAVLANADTVVDAALLLAQLSMFLCFFNLLPIPPLDGSHVMRQIVGMSLETFWSISRYGFFIVILVIQIPAVRHFLHWATISSIVFFGHLLRLPF